MAGSSNFLRFNPSLNNALSDIDYNSNATRTNGLNGGVARSDLHNKMFYQWSIMTAALAQVLSNRGFNVNDADFTNLVTTLNNLISVNNGVVDAQSLKVSNIANGTGLTDAVNLGQFGSILNNTGYQKLPSGLIIQWGSILNSSNDIVTILPIAFTTNFLQIIVANKYTAGTGQVGYVAASPTTLSTFTSRGSNAFLGACFIAVGY